MLKPPRSMLWRSFARAKSAPKVLLGMLGLVLLSTPAFAERADRRKPVVIDAGEYGGDNKAKFLQLKKGVTISQGTLKIVGDTADVKGDVGVYVAVLKGTPVVCFRQKKDGKDEVMRGQAQRIEYDQGKEKVEFFGNVVVHDGPDEMRGDYVIYYMNTEKFEMRDKPGAQGRFVMVPKDKDEPDEAAQAAAAAKDPAKPRMKSAKEIELGRYEPLASKCIKEAL